MKTDYQKVFDQIELSNETIEQLRTRKKPVINKKSHLLRNLLYIAASLICIFGISNVVSYAAMGNPWIIKVTNMDSKKRNQENIEQELERLENELKQTQQKVQQEIEQNDIDHPSQSVGQPDQKNEDTSSSAVKDKKEREEELNSKLEAVKKELEELNKDH